MTTKNQIELLAPAGNLAILRTAIDSGADSVYLGLKEFSARASADNFTLDDNMLIRRVFYTIKFKIFQDLSNSFYQDIINK